MTSQVPSQAILVLENGSVFEGNAYGATGRALGTIQVYAAATGYQEILTQESTRENIVLFTNPHIGSTGVNEEDARSQTMHAQGVIVRDPARIVSNFRATGNLEQELLEHQVVGISGVDTRAITHEAGAASQIRAGIFSGPNAELPVEELIESVKNA